VCLNAIVAERAARDLDGRAQTKAECAFGRFVASFNAKYVKAKACLLKDREALLALHDFPAEQLVYIRTTNVIASTFATIGHHSDRATGCVSRDSIPSMLFKLG
jgi:putative transposase